ncbi:MAG: glycosyl transferase group 1 [Pseudanabaena frigida]|uniref:Glycosyl transferase group 1 n=1 Tax=Pseudanabaena frigida TaxID=945775 RepID=A0A2W4WDW2_9CYAN|nr:MAG: glycosyl transferase group 1 [Pseudanabaena frigida]
MPSQLIVEGWRFLPHSYSIINQFQCLEILKRQEIQLFHLDSPHYKDDWVNYNNLFNPADSRALAEIKSPDPNQIADVTLRIEFPFRLDLSNSKRTYVFMTSEKGYVPNYNLQLQCSLAEAHSNSEVVLITPSNWAKSGLVRSGADPNRTVIIPHGIDPTIYKPLSEEERILLRKQLGIDGFIFLSVGAMNGAKRADLVLKSFARVLEKYPDARLILKGLDNIHKSRDWLNMARGFLTDAEASRAFSRLTYVGDSLPFHEVAKLYQIADAYIAPYSAEGFCLPVLEAAACGLPVICTRGGATDDFTNSDFALHIDSQIIEIAGDDPAICLEPNLESLVSLMHLVIERDSFRNSAKINGASFVHQNFTWKHVVDQLLNVLELV